MEDQARQTLSKLNEVLDGRFPYRFEMVNPSEIQLLEKNARYMDQPMFQNLVENVRQDGALSSLPLCHRTDGDALEVLSGNHRVQAAVHAELKEIIVLIVDRDLSRDEQLSIQLSHNSIEGKDDLVILRELFSEIQDVNFKTYAGLDSETLDAFEKLDFTTLSDPRPDFEQIILQFLPEEATSLAQLVEEADTLFSLDHNYLLSRRHYDQVFEVIVEVKEKFNIISNPAAVMKLMEMAREKLSELPEPEPEKTTEKTEKKGEKTEKSPA